jgi:hypothetical protein
VAAKTDTRSFKDPRNAVGLLADVLDVVLASPALQAPLFTDWEELHPVVATRDVGREFAKSSRQVFNGYARKGYSTLYQRAKALIDKLLLDEMWLLKGHKREVIETTRSLSRLIISTICHVMEDVTRWNKPAPEHRDPEMPYWHLLWHDFVSSALRLGADQGQINKCECEWRWRDITDRSHRGRNMRAAFEAAWLAGAHDFALQMLKVHEDA